MTKSNLVDLEVQVLHLTEKAVKFTTDGNNEIWLPLSLCEIETKDPRGLVGGAIAILTSEQHILEEKGAV